MPFSIKRITSGKTATEEYFQSIYLNPKAENNEDKIIFHRPLFESLTTGIICLKSLRLENCLGLVLQAPKSILKTFSEKILELDKVEKLGDRPSGEIFEKLKNEALKSGVAIVYEQRPDLESKAAVDLSEGNPRPWTPKIVHQKIAEIVPILNRSLKDLEIFVWPTIEYTDDIPILRLLSGPGDPYTAERLGSFAFFSTQRGMEWYSKQFGKTDFEPHSGMVFVSYFCDLSMKETPECKLSLNSTNQAWVDAILSHLKIIAKRSGEKQLNAVIAAMKSAGIRKSELEIINKKESTIIKITTAQHKAVCLKYILGDKIKEVAPGVAIAKILR